MAPARRGPAARRPRRCRRRRSAARPGWGHRRSGRVGFRLGFWLGVGLRLVGFGRRHPVVRVRPGQDLGYGGEHHRLVLLRVAGRDGRAQPGRVADELGQEALDATGAAHVADVPDLLPAWVEQLVAEVVQAAGYAGPHLPRPEHPAVLLGRAGYAGRRDAGPAAGQGRVQQPGQVDHVALRVAGRHAVQRRVDAEADQPDRAGVVEQHVLGREQPMGDAVRVRGRDRVGHLADHPRPTSRRERPVAREHDVERGAGPPLVDDEAAVAAVRSASSTRRMRWSRTVAERRAASRSRSARGSSAAITWRATCRSRMRSCARQNRPPPLSLSRSTSRYRSASTSPARVACGTVLPSGLLSLPRSPMVRRFRREIVGSELPAPG